MNYQFKVGDKGKTETGSDYEVISLLSPPVDNWALIARITGKGLGVGAVLYRTAEGKSMCSYDKKGSFGDLLPPTRTVYVNLYKEHMCYEYFVSEEDARRVARITSFKVVAIAVPVEIQG